MALLHRKRVIKVAIESVKGTKVAGTQALFVQDLDIKPTAEFVERKGAGTHCGHTEPGTLNEPTGACSFKVEMRSNGSAALEPGLAILLQAGGLKDATGYKPCSVVSDQKTISIDVWEDGKKKMLRGAMGTIKIEGETGKTVYMTCEFSGLWVTAVDEAIPAFAPSTTTPMKMSSGTFTVGGAAKKISKYSLEIGADVVAEPDVNATGGISSYIITDFNPALSFDPEAELVASYDAEGIWTAGTEFAVVLAMTDGTDTITITCPKAQYKELPEGEREGITVWDATCQCNNDSGDDALAIVTS